MTLLDHLLAIILVVVGPLLSGTVALRRFRAASPAEMPAVRRRAYRTAVTSQWLRVLATGMIWWIARRSLADLGLVPRFGAGFIGVAAGLAIIVFVMIRQRRIALADDESFAEIRTRLGNVEFLLPHTRSEFRSFVGVALTAGTCEELLYRGYLIWYFSHALPWWAAGLVSAVAFGFGHVYQGARGVMVTTLLGVFLGAVYFLSGSLFCSMLIHALMDLHTGDLAWRAYEREASETPDAAAGAAPDESPA